MKTIEHHAFSNSGLTNIDLGQVESIDQYAFSGCDYLGNVTFPKTLNHMGTGAFAGCKSITEVVIGQDIATDPYTGENRSYPGVFNDCSSLKRMVFASGVTAIPRGIGYSTNGNIGLEVLEIPASVKTIGDTAFYNCDHLVQVKFASGSQLSKIESDAFSQLDALQVFSIPETKAETLHLYTTSIAKNAKLMQLNLPTTTKVILYSDALSENPSLTTLHITKNLSVDPYAKYGPFSDCNNVKTVTFEDGIKQLDRNLLRTLRGLEEADHLSGM